MDKELFNLAIEAAVTLEREGGIGILSEGVLHSAVKYYYQADRGLQEIEIDGFVCDAIADDREYGRTVIEVQTANFGNLKKKLSVFLADGGGNEIPLETDEAPLSELSGIHEATFPGRVTVVYPMESEKHTVWIDPETGEAQVGRKSPIGFSPARCLRELYYLKEWIGHSRFRFIILGMKVKEEKLLCGRSRDRKRFGARRIARIPLELTHELVFRSLEDYAALVPASLPEHFDAKAFKRAAKMSEKRASLALKTLLDMGLVTRERNGRSYIYTRVYSQNG